MGNNKITLSDYQNLSTEQKIEFIEQVNNNLKHKKNKIHYTIFNRVRQTAGQIILYSHQSTPGRLTAVEELKRTDIHDRKVYILCLCDCGNWHICRTDAYKKGTTNGGCYSCGCLNAESLSKNIFNVEVQNKRVEKLKEHLHDKGLQIGDQVYDWLITQVKTEPAVSKKGTRKYVKGICPYCHQESHWIRADGITSGTVHSCGCAQESIGEQKIRQLLQSNGLSFEQEHTFDTCISPVTGAKFRWDFYVNNKYLIEFDGIQHFETKGRFTEEAVLNIQQRDFYKNQWCFKNNIPLIRIPYTHLTDIALSDLIPETSRFIVKGGQNNDR